MPLTPDQDRRLAAKRINEATKLSATLLNNLAVGSLITGLLAPALTGRYLDPAWWFAVAMTALALHVSARITVSGLQSEE